MEPNTKYVADRLRKVAAGSAPTPSLQVLARQGADVIEELAERVETLEAQQASAKPARRKPATKATEKPAEEPGDEGEGDED